MALFFFQFKDHPKVQATLIAVRPAVVALLALVVYDIFPKSVKGWDTALIAGVTFIAVAFLKIHPALAILAAAIVGVIFY